MLFFHFSQFFLDFVVVKNTSLFSGSIEDNGKAIFKNMYYLYVFQRF